MATLLHSSITGCKVPQKPSLIILPSQSNSIYIIHSTEIQLQTLISGDNSEIVCCCLSPSGSVLVFVSREKQLNVYTYVEDMGWLLSYCKQIPIKAIQSMCITNSEKDILFADKSGCVYTIPLKDTEIDLCELSPVLGHCSILTSVTTSATDKYVITADSEGKIRVSNYPNAYNIHSFLLSHSEFVSHLSFLSGCPNRILSGSGDGSIKLWDFECSVLLSTLNINNSPIYIMNVSSHGHIIVAVEGKNILYLVRIRESILTLLHTIELESQPYSGCFGCGDICWISTCDSFHAFAIIEESNFKQLTVSEDPYLSYLSKNPVWCLAKNSQDKYFLLKKRPFTQENKYFEQKQEWIEAKKRKLKSSNTQEP